MFTFFLFFQLFLRTISQSDFEQKVDEAIPKIKTLLLEIGKFGISNDLQKILFLSHEQKLFVDSLNIQIESLIKEILKMTSLSVFLEKENVFVHLSVDQKATEFLIDKTLGLLSYLLKSLCIFTERDFEKTKKIGKWSYELDSLNVFVEKDSKKQEHCFSLPENLNYSDFTQLLCIFFKRKKGNGNVGSYTSSYQHDSAITFYVQTQR